MNTTNPEIQMPATGRRHVRYSEEFKRQVIKVCLEPGVSKAIGFWLAARRLYLGHFVWPAPDAQAQVNLSHLQLDALVLGLPWSRLGEGGIITVV